jgi:adenylate cyclase
MENPETVSETPAVATAHMLVVDDNEQNRDVLVRRLQRMGYDSATAENGVQALEAMRSQPFDAVLLDIMMPGMNGFQVLERMQADEQLRHLPVIVISALDDMDSIVRCINLGADDYLTKPFNRMLLEARLRATLDKKRLRDQEQQYLHLLQAEREKAERLLLNILPKAIAERLKVGESQIADRFEDVSVLFARVIDFNHYATNLPAKQLVGLLNGVFSQFDRLVEQYELEKIKTSGDLYMVVGGLPTPRSDHVDAMADMALAMQKTVAQTEWPDALPMQMRIGIHCGPVVAGVIGERKFSYDLWGDTVNVASRMETLGVTGAIQVSKDLYRRLKSRYDFEPRGMLPVKGKGDMMVFLLKGCLGN